MDFKIKVTFADGSRRVLKDPSELTKANKRREIRVVFQDGKYTDLHLGRVCPKLGIVKVNTFGLLLEGIKLEKSWDGAISSLIKPQNVNNHDSY